MFRLPPLQLVFSIGALAIAACGENQSPTQPETGVEGVPGAPLAALTSNTWTSKAALPAAFFAVGLSAGSVPNAAGQSIVYTFGGTDDMGGHCGSIGAYNVATNTWAGLGFDNQCGSEMNGVGRIGNTLYFSGGRVHGGDGVEILRTAWAFDAGAKTLTRKADMPRGTARGVTGVIDGKVYVLPGICSTDFWPSPGGGRAVGAVLQSRLFVIVGLRTYAYDPRTNKWSAKASPKYLHPAVVKVTFNGLPALLAVGGIQWTPDATPVPSELYTP